MERSAPSVPEQQPGDPCGHEDMRVDVEVAGIEDRPGTHMATIKVECSLCGVPFKFLGLPAGVSFLEPRVNITSRELIAPITPDPGAPTLQDRATFSLAHRDS